jgi:hypothetical protein
MKKKPKKYAEGGLSGIANTAQDLMSQVDSVSNSLKYGSSGGQGPIGGSGALGFLGSQFEPGVMKPNYFGGPRPNPPPLANPAMAFGNASKMKKGGKVKSASARADGIAIRGKTRA